MCAGYDAHAMSPAASDLAVPEGVARARAQRGVGVGRRIYLCGKKLYKREGTRSAPLGQLSPFPSSYDHVSLLPLTLLYSPSSAVPWWSLIFFASRNIHFANTPTPHTLYIYHAYPEFLCENLTIRLSSLD